jgi:predicted transcriptional regulator
MTAEIGIKSTDDFFKDVERKWTAIDRGEPVPGPVTRIYFESAEALARVLTRQRQALLQALHAQGALSVRGLAALLQRDYKNVHQDVRILEESGLIERDNKNHIMAPYEKLTIELPLTA